MNNPPIILHVEDNAENRLLVRRLLLSEGYQIYEAENAKKALQIVREHIPDLDRKRVV